MSKQETVELSQEELESLLNRLSDKPAAEDIELTKQIFESYSFIYQTLKNKNQSIKNLQRIIFGPSSEKSKDVLKHEEGQDDVDEKETEGGASNDSDKEKAPKKRTTGKLSHADYPNAKVCPLKHESLSDKDQCPVCGRGKVHPYLQENKIIKISGNVPMMATKYELENFRCNACGEIFKPDLPKDVCKDKYDPAAISMLALLKYGTGMPFYRLDKFLRSLGTPFPKSTQWDLMDQNSAPFELVFDVLCLEAAQGELFYNDDTSVKILSLENKVNRGHEKKGRKGLQTSGIISKVDKHKIALFFSGHRHAGENLESLLGLRDLNLEMPIQMCDGKRDNIPKGHETILSNCLAHARRKFVELIDNFPEQCKFILKVFRKIYKFDSETKEQLMSPQQRLEFHIKNSLPLMKGLYGWFAQQFKEKKIEPNSNLGTAINYMKKRWGELIKFTEVAGAPLDNNICEQALKKAILLRKNALFYKTSRGSQVGDIFISLIQTCEMNKINSFEFLKAVLDHKSEVLAFPQNWTPFNFRENLI